MSKKNKKDEKKKIDGKEAAPLVEDPDSVPNRAFTEM